MLGTLVTLLDWLSVAVFAVTGALVASRKEMDIFGFALLATVTGIGGGTVRDLLMGAVPVFWVRDPSYLIVCTATAVLVFFTAHVPESRYRTLLWFDAVGLSFACVIGTSAALSAGAVPLVAAVMGVVTGTFGGMARDILGGESPVILRKEIYVTAALAGAVVVVTLLWLRAPSEIAGLSGFATCFVIRALALRYGWSLPTYRGRPAGPISEETDKLGL